MVHRLIKAFFLFTCVVLVSSCATGKRFINSTTSGHEIPSDLKPIYTVYGVGDTGEKNAQSAAVIRHLAELAEDDQQDGTILFLGDNVYPAGLAPPEMTFAHQYGKDLLESQINALSGYKGDIIFIPGNHDWNEFKPGGLEAVKRQADFIDAFQKPNLGFYPKNGCPGPEVFHLAGNVLLIILDTQWWIQSYFGDAELNAECSVRTKEEFIAQYKRILTQNADKQIIVALHHPLKSEGAHGGHYSLRDHVFPLTHVVRWLYLPLPVIGSIYPWYRTVLGHPQDLKNKRYSSMRDAILDVSAARKDLIFLSGHDHNLQYLASGKHHFVISGSGSKQNGVANGKELIYGHSAGGFVTLDMFENGAIQLTIYEVDTGKDTREAVFREIIVKGR